MQPAPLVLTMKVEATMLMGFPPLAEGLAVSGMMVGSTQGSLKGVMALAPETR